MIHLFLQPIKILPLLYFLKEVITREAKGFQKKRKEGNALQWPLHSCIPRLEDSESFEFCRHLYHNELRWQALQMRVRRVIARRAWSASNFRHPETVRVFSEEFCSHQNWTSLWYSGRLSQQLSKVEFSIHDAVKKTFDQLPTAVMIIKDMVVLFHQLKSGKC